MSLESMLRTTATHKRTFPATKDAEGGKVAATVTITSGVPCDIQPASSNTVWRYQQRALSVSHTVYLSRAITWEASDILTSDGRTFLILGAQPSPPGYNQWPSVLDVMEWNV